VDRFVVISGCSGGGKSTLLAELGRRGHAVVEEPGRRIVQEERERRGTALPWVDPQAFARRAIAMSLEDRDSAAARKGWVFFDRGLIDAVTGLQHLTGESDAASVLQNIRGHGHQEHLVDLRRTHRYHRRVFLAPPWPEIYATDSERRHGLTHAVAEYERLLVAYPALGYEVVLLPKVGVAERADFVLAMLPAERNETAGPSVPVEANSRTAP
jgi:predicted ATPase